ncbi:hypothetical protein SEA_MACGULLY_7 [Rhodococcus phage MacGully]|nr:hypothetical protein SEA_MACGULLY_7 [Rhodococcus phage MacGully]
MSVGSELNAAIEDAEEALMERINDIRRDNDMTDAEIETALNALGDSDVADRWRDWIAG